MRVVGSRPPWSDRVLGVFCLSMYMLASMIVVSPLVISSVIVSSSESCVISVASTFLFVIITAALLRASPAVNVLYCVSIPTALP